MAEYNTLLIGLQLAHEMGVRYLEAYGDSKLIINQVKGEYEVHHEDLVPYYHAVIEMANLFDDLYIGHVSRSQNTKADALAALATKLALPVDIEYHLTVATRHLVCSKHMLRTRGSIISRQILSRGIGDFLSSTILYMVCCQTILKKRYLSDEGLSGFTMIQL